MLELYHFDRSTAARKIRLALAEKGLAWQGHSIDTGLDRRDRHDPEYLEDAFPEPGLRSSYTEAIVDWGDTTSQKRVELGTQAIPKLKQQWDGKCVILPDTAHRPVNSLK